MFIINKYPEANAGTHLYSETKGNRPPGNGGTALELSVVMPCLNEAETLATCIEKAQRSLHEHHIRGEVIVADNGSTDGSQEIAARMGARVVEAFKNYLHNEGRVRCV